MRRHIAQDLVRQTRPQIADMIKQAQQLAGEQQAAVIESANVKMRSLQQSELSRMQALATVNPNIRQQEIDYLIAQTDELQDYLSAAQIKLEAMRVAVVTD